FGDTVHEQPAGEIFAELADALVALAALLREASRQNHPELAVAGREIERGWDRVFDDVTQERVVVRFLERHAPGDALVQHHAKGPNVRAMIDVREAARLLRRHVIR